MSQCSRACRVSLARSIPTRKGISFNAAAFPVHRFPKSNGPKSFPEREDGAKRAAIRPLTLFAICIPLGYALSWGLKTHGDAGDADGFVKYTLAKKEAVSSTCSIFTLAPTTTSVLQNEPVASRSIVSVQFKQPQLQIARFYTLLPPTPEQDPNTVRFLIRKERNGEVSGYLHRLPLGADLELRGMCVEYTLPDEVDKVLFLAGGTGIAPAMQVADALAGKADIHVLWASRRREDCAGGVSDTRKAGSNGWSLMRLNGLFDALRGTPSDKQDTSTLEQSLVVAQLEALKKQSAEASSSSDGNKRLKVDYYVDDEGTFITQDEVSRLLDSAWSQNGKNIVFVAGPDGFVNHWAASKIWANGKEIQGPIGGALSQLNIAGWEVVKL